MSETRGSFSIPHRSERPNSPLFPPLPGVGVAAGMGNAAHTHTQCRQSQSHRTSLRISRWRLSPVLGGGGSLPALSILSGPPVRPHTDNTVRPQKSNQHTAGFWGCLALLLQQRCSTEWLEP